MRHVKTLQRENGDTIEIVSNVHGDIFMNKPSVDTFVKVLRGGQAEWEYHYFGNNGNAGTKDMSREEYMCEGRPSIFKQATIGELLNAQSEALGEFNRYGNDLGAREGETPDLKQKISPM